MIRFSCPECDTSLKSADDKAGTKTTCPNCGERLSVPASSEPEKKAARSKKDAGARKGGAVAAPQRRGRVRDDDEDADDDAGSPSAKKGKKSSTMLYVGIGIAACAVLGVGGVLASSFLFPDKPKTQVATNPPVIAPPPPPPPITTGKPGATNKNTPPNAPPAKTPPEPAADVTKKPETKSPEPPPPLPPLPDSSGVRGLDPTVVYQRLLRSSAWIVTKIPADRSGGGDGYSIGSGSLVDAKNRLVLTNYHVVMHALKDEKTRIPMVMFPQYDRGEVDTDRRNYFKRLERDGIAGRVIHFEMERDLAVIQLVGVPETIVPIRLARGSVRPGEQILSIGNPNTTRGGLSASEGLWVPTQGRVRLVRRDKFSAGDNEGKVIVEMDAFIVSTDSPINPGDSGGPLVNERCELVGVTESTSTVAQGLSKFIDIREVKEFLKEAYKKNPTLTPPEEKWQGSDEVVNVQDLVRMLEGNDQAKKIRAASDLGRIGLDARAGVPGLIHMLDDKDQTVRKSGIDALVQIGVFTQSDVPALRKILKDSDPDIRLQAVNALKQMREEASDAVPDLGAALKDPDPRIRLQAIKALNQLGAAARPALAEIAARLKDAKDPSEDVRIEAAQALGKISGAADKLVPVLEAALKDDSREVRLQALASLEAMGPDAKAALDTVINQSLKKDRDRAIRQKAIDVLAAVGPEAKPAMTTLIKYLVEDSDLRASASKALSKIGKPAVVPLVGVLSNKVPDVRGAAIDALGDIGPDALKDSLRILLRLAGTEKRLGNEENVKKIAEAVRKIQLGGK